MVALDTKAKRAQYRKDLEKYTVTSVDLDSRRSMTLNRNYRFYIRLRTDLLFQDLIDFRAWIPYPLDGER